MTDQKNHGGVVCPDQIDPTARRDMIKFLPEALLTAIESYKTLSGQVGKPEEDEVGGVKTKTAKDFQDHHNALKAALSHIELLMKLAEQLHIWAETDERNDLDEVQKLVHAALADQADYRARVKDDGGDDD